MLSIPNIKKWKADKEYYSFKFVSYVKKEWSRELNVNYKKIMIVKKQATIDKYNKMINKCLDYLFKLNIILEDFE